MRALVTGGAGFIGSHLVDQLIESGHEVRVIDDLSTGRLMNLHSGAEFIKASIGHVDILTAIMGGVDVVFHVAALPRIQRAIDEPQLTHAVNVTGTLNVLEAARRNKIRRIVYSSSSSVYGKNGVMSENMCAEPRSMYAAQKLASEHYCSMYAVTHNMSIASLRYFNVYGPRQLMDDDYCLVLGKFLRQKADGQRLTIYGDGSQTRSFTWVGDVVAANIMAAQAQLPEASNVVMNIGSDEETSISRLAELVGGEYELIQPNPRAQFEEQRKSANYEWAEALIGWRPTVNIEQGLKLTLERL